MSWENVSTVLTTILYMVSAVLFIRGIKLLGKADTARKGNLLSSVGMLIAVVTVLLEKNVTDTLTEGPAKNAYIWTLAAIVLGGVIGAVWAKKVEMTGMPQLVALFNGFGGLSSLLVALTQYMTDKSINVFSSVALGLTIAIGAIAFTGSVVAWGKLSGKLFKKNISIPGKNAINALLALIGVIAACTLIFSNMQSRRRATIREDEGLSIQILSQPDSFTPEGDISLRVKAPETIQSITINGENIDIQQGRTVDLDYHAQTGALEVMVVSTDKVRSADITLAYVDSQPPVVTVSEKDGMIELTAEDKETGVKAVYIGMNDGLSDVPTYEEYTEPIPADPNAVFSYYATDEAGNSSTPAVSAMVPATAIEFPQNRYGIFPGSETPLQVVTTPENAFVNNLTYEIENEKVAKISNGILTGVSEGDTKVIASADGLPSASATVSVKTDRSVTISCVGDCTLGTDINLSANTSFNAYQATYGNSYFFENVRDILSQDDATFANFEGTLTTLDESYRKDKPYAFKADPSYAEILNDGSIEVVTLANNHTYDYGDQSTQDTKDALDAAGVNWCSGDDIAYMDLNGVKTAFIGIYALENGLESMDQVKSTVAEAKENGADLVIIHFHWGVELVTTLDDFERQLAHAAIDAGADLVLGTHAHMILPVEKYNGRYIVYGLSNFCFGGNPYPHSYDTIIWQQTFSFTPDGLESEDDISIIPCSISSETSINNYQPTPVTGDKAAEIIQTMNSLSTEFGLTFDQYMKDGTQSAG